MTSAGDPREEYFPTTIRVLRSFQRFARMEASGGILLFVCTLVALFWANSPWEESYLRLWHTHVSLGFGGAVLAKPLLLWINDALMAIFFFVVGLEIKQEVLVGELASPRKALLPIVAAVGGMVVPAGLYAAFNAGGPGAAGWGIPMATDIAFSLGVLALLGKRVPLALKVFLTALAIVDDLGAVLVIALFYTHEISWASLAVAAIFLILLVLANRLGIRHSLVYAVLGAGLWLAFLKSGVHATVAGVLVAMTVPARARIDPAEFLARSRQLLGDFERGKASGVWREETIYSIGRACSAVGAPLQQLEHSLHPWVTFGILPLFALANAGVTLTGNFTQALFDPVSLGILFGLVVGKSVGVTLFSWLAVRAGWASLPAEIGWRHIHGVAWLAGIGFTMSLFIAALAFGEAPPLATAKLAILTASVVAGVVGWLILSTASAPPRGNQVAGSDSSG